MLRERGETGDSEGDTRRREMQCRDDTPEGADVTEEAVIGIERNIVQVRRVTVILHYESECLGLRPSTRKEAQKFTSSNECAIIHESEYVWIITDFVRLIVVGEGSTNKEECCWSGEWIV